MYVHDAVHTCIVIHVHVYEILTHNTLFVDEDCDFCEFVHVYVCIASFVGTCKCLYMNTGPYTVHGFVLILLLLHTVIHTVHVKGCLSLCEMLRGPSGYCARER